jgi:ribosomal-protein-alanine N-acetyltransferase
MSGEATLFRPFVASDADAVAALEALCNPQPWRSDDLRPFAPVREGEGSSFYQTGQVAVAAGGTLVGYAFASLVAGEAELLLLGVHPGSRRLGIGAALLEALCDRLREAGADSIFLEVLRGNQAAIRLYENFDFALNGVRAGYYADNGEDAMLYRKEL